MPLFARSVRKARDRRFQFEFSSQPLESRIAPATGVVSPLALTLPGTVAGGAPVDGAGSQSAPPATPIGSVSTAPVDGGGQSAPPPTSVGSVGSSTGSNSPPPPTMLSTLADAVTAAREELAVEVNGLALATVHRLQVLNSNPYLVHHPRQLAALDATTLRTFSHDLDNLVTGFRAFELRSVQTYVNATRRQESIAKQLHNHPNQLARQEAIVQRNYSQRLATLSQRFHSREVHVLAVEGRIEHETQRLVIYGANHPGGPLPIGRR